MTYTIGHSNHSIDQFIERLVAHRIQVLVDVRSYPKSSYVPHFNRVALKASLKLVRIKYTFKGKTLGADGPSVTNQRFKETMGYIRNLSDQYRVALMCAELNPAKCHRASKLTAFLLASGSEVTHITKEGLIEGFELQRVQKPGWVDPQYRPKGLFN